MLQNLIDIRDLFPGDRDSVIVYLQNQQFVPFDASIARVAKSDEIGSTCGLDLLIRVIRHLLAHLAEDWYGPDPGEVPNALLELAWADLERQDGRETHKARVDVLKAFYPDQDLVTQDLSFETLAKHELMHKSIWRRLPFLLFDPHTWSRKIGRDDDRFEPDDANENPQDWRSGLAQQSLVDCNRSDFPSLKEAVEGRFGIFSDPQRGREYVFQFNEPGVIRARYDYHHGPGPSNTENVMTLENLRAVEGPQPGVLVPPEPGSRLIEYNKVAAVHMYENPKSDFLELFHLDGSPIQVTQEGNSHQVGCVAYMFFYLQAPPLNVRAPPPVPDSFDADITRQKAIGCGALPDPELTQSQGRQGAAQGTNPGPISPLTAFGYLNSLLPVRGRRSLPAPSRPHQVCSSRGSRPPAPFQPPIWFRDPSSLPRVRVRGSLPPASSRPPPIGPRGRGSRSPVLPSSQQESGGRGDPTRGDSRRGRSRGGYAGRRNR